MTGHFEKGAWIEDPKLPPEPVVVEVRIDVDDTQVQQLKATIEALQQTIEFLCKGYEMLKKADLEYARQIAERWGSK